MGLESVFGCILLAPPLLVTGFKFPRSPDQVASGKKTRRDTDLNSEQPGNLVCSVCQVSLKNPHTACREERIFFKACLDQPARGTRCPSCRGENVVPALPSRPVNKIILGIRDFPFAPTPPVRGEWHWQLANPFEQRTPARVRARSLSSFLFTNTTTAVVL